MACGMHASEKGERSKHTRIRRAWSCSASARGGLEIALAILAVVSSKGWAVEESPRGAGTPGSVAAGVVTKMQRGPIRDRRTQPSYLDDPGSRSVVGAVDLVPCLRMRSRRILPLLAASALLFACRQESTTVVAPHNVGGAIMEDAATRTPAPDADGDADSCPEDAACGNMFGDTIGDSFGAGAGGLGATRARRDLRRSPTSFGPGTRGRILVLCRRRRRPAVLARLTRKAREASAEQAAVEVSVKLRAHEGGKRDRERAVVDGAGFSVLEATLPRGGATCRRARSRPASSGEIRSCRQGRLEKYRPPRR